MKNGELLFGEGGSGDLAYVIMEGEVEISKLSDGTNVRLAVRGAGELIGEMALLEEAPRMASARAVSDCRLLAIGREQLEELLSCSPSSARAMLRTVTERLRETEAMLRQKEKLAQLGTLAAGMAHELNNPASAVQRGAVQLSSAVTQILEVPAALRHLGLSSGQMHELERRLPDMARRAAKPDTSDPLERGDREELIEGWLEIRGIEKRAVYAPELVDMGYTVEDLERLEQTFSGPHLQPVIDLLCAAFVAHKVLREIGEGSGQIAAIVKAMKSYVYLDQAPIQDVDIHEGLENTLVILKHKLKRGIRVQRDFADQLPPVRAYGSELNQVWTNLIDNAADALEGSGEIHLKTRVEDSFVVVEVEDNGPGIPKEIQPKIFTLFFTTKPMGKGSGQGLHISHSIVRRHGGTIESRSRPGKTVFTVCIPVNFQKNSAAVPLKSGIQQQTGKNPEAAVPKGV
ncbi:MAG: cyclic nucleotide-binding domain-containing protein [Spirochaetaceae bacterium]|nr:MAG: cyclic nucleotide-binding domain-containing protein [Spirochaetaceae bacterium]